MMYLLSPWKIARAGRGDGWVVTLRLAVGTMNVFVPDRVAS